MQGPLGLNGSRRIGGWPAPCLENGALAAVSPPSMERLRSWQSAGITVKGRPDWVFIKLHCHGMDPRDETALLGTPMVSFLRHLTGGDGTSDPSRLHFVTAREMTNIILAACDGREGSPGNYRDYRLGMITPPRKA